MQRQVDEDSKAEDELAEHVTKYGAFFLVAAGGGGGVFKSPMGGQWVAGPVRAGFACGVVAHCDDEIHLRRIGRAKLVPALATQILYRIVDSFNLLNR